ncbi:sensor domain-containing diguanylate cyclase [Paenibacillus humicola]|uniref:sensor domain-containing diguanylate cyclase n=1 Tax=Paenibacillus humicola TaxID=3110540 RepID=UPI00237AED1B|nr:sensor domain-containing diguanylate cyclase [Paenibacillus humicola]
MMLTITVHRPKLTLMKLLAGLVAGSALLITLILLVSSYQSEKKSLVDTTLSLNYSSAQKISVTIDSLFESMQRSLHDTALFLSKNGTLSDREIQEQLELVLNTSGYFNSLFISDRAGVIREVAPNALGLKGSRLTTKAASEARRSGKPYISPPYIAITGRMIVLMSEPLYDAGGNANGFIGGTIYLQENNILSKIIGNNILDDTGSYFYVVGPNGQLLSHPDKNRIGDDGSPNPVVRKLMRGEQGKQEVVNTKGVPMFAAYVPAPVSGWGIVQQTPVSSIHKKLAATISRLVLYMLAPFIALLLLSVWIARMLARPFSTLAGLMKRLSDGERVALADTKPHWIREVNLLTKAVLVAIDAVHKNNTELIRAAATDTLTGLMNRRTLDDILAKWTENGQLFSLIILDIDRFKAVNDTYGHQVGDEVLKFLSRMITEAAGLEGICCRFGGEEFVILLPGATAAEAHATAEKIRLAMQQTGSPTGSPVTVSLGIAEFPAHADTPEALFRLADEALYEAKQRGRNRTVLAGSSDGRALSLN